MSGTTMRRNRILSAGATSNLFGGGTTQDLFLEHLQESPDATTQSWARLIAPVMASIGKARRIEVQEIVEWIYSTEQPVDIFEFSAWAKLSPAPANLQLVRKAIA